MQKEEFPTFLNEQPTVIFGRTTRELMIIAIGISLAYLVWGNMDALVGVSIGGEIFKGFCCLLVLVAAVIVALVAIGSRPLEEWILVGILYFLVPKVYIYMPVEVADEDADEKADERREKNMKLTDEEDDEY